MPDQPHAFISYVREDSAAVDRLCKFLENANIPYWRDRKDLGPGDEWKAKIREQIRSGSFVFLACFSENYHKRVKSMMNEELMLAVEEFRQIAPGHTWIIPIRLDDVELPPVELRPNLLLSGLNYVSLFGDSLAEEAVALTTTVARLLGRPASDPASVRTSVAEAAAEDRSHLVRRQTKEWVLDPTRQIDLADLINDESRRILSALRDGSLFPLSLSASTQGVERGVEIADQVRAIWNLTTPFYESLDVAVRWGEPSSLDPWKSALRAFCLEADSMRNGGGHSSLLDLRHLPVVASAITIGFAAVRSQRWANVKALLAEVSIPSRVGPPFTVLEVSNPWSAFDVDSPVIHALAREVGKEKSKPFEELLADFLARRVGKLYTPVSDWLFEVMRPMLDDGPLGQDAYARDFDRAEVMLGIIAEDQVIQRRNAAGGAGWFPHGQWFGRSTWRSGHHYYGTSNPVEEVQLELQSQGANWYPVQAGLLGGDLERATVAIETYRNQFEQIASSRF